jgi:hypothetical protein
MLAVWALCKTPLHSNRSELLPAVCGNDVRSTGKLVSGGSMQNDLYVFLFPAFGKDLTNAGAKGEMKWTRGPDGLRIWVPQDPPGHHAYCFKILAA